MEALIGAAIGFLLGIPVVKQIIDKTAVPVEEVSELLIAIAEAVKDGKVTPEEMKQIQKEGGDVLAVFSRIGKADK